MAYEDSVCCGVVRLIGNGSDDDSDPRASNRRTEPGEDDDNRTSTMIYLEGGQFSMGTDSDAGFF